MQHTMCGCCGKSKATTKKKYDGETYDLCSTCERQLTGITKVIKKRSHSGGNHK